EATRGGGCHRRRRRSTGRCGEAAPSDFREARGGAPRGQEVGHQTLDASALTAYYAREPGWKRMAQLFAAARDGREPLAMHAVNVGEVYYVAYRQAGAARAAEMLAHRRRLPVRIHDRVPVDRPRDT